MFQYLVRLAFFFFLCFSSYFFLFFSQINFIINLCCSVERKTCCYFYLDCIKCIGYFRGNLYFYDASYAFPLVQSYFSVFQECFILFSSYIFTFPTRHFLTPSFSSEAVLKSRRGNHNVPASVSSSNQPTGRNPGWNCRNVGPKSCHWWWDRPATWPHAYL